MLRVTRTRSGRAYLHVWRDGEEYFRQKSPRFLDEWTNVRYVAVPKRPIRNVFYVDLSRHDLDFSDRTFDAANAYHVLEHLTAEQGERFAAELFRVLKPGGIVRISVPDLERICGEYLHYLALVREDPSQRNLHRYRWAVMEIFEQMVREKSGGRMAEALRAGEYDPEHIEERYSDIFRPIIRASQATPSRDDRANRRPLLFRIPRAVQRIVRTAHREWKYGDVRDPSVSKERVRWMYDRISLRSLLEGVGFTDVAVMDFERSGIPDWERYDLDAAENGRRPIDPSVYVEARRPERDEAA